MQPGSRNLPEARVTEQYKEHLSKPFFPSLKHYIMGGPVFLMVWEGSNVVSIVRKVIGATNPQEAVPGTIRGDFGIDIGRNVIHASDSPESAAREIGIHFKPSELSRTHGSMNPCCTNTDFFIRLDSKNQDASIRLGHQNAEGRILLSSMILRFRTGRSILRFYELSRLRSILP